MQTIDYYSLLIRFNRNILSTMFDFLCTETMFLSIALINKHFHLKTQEYIQISQTIQIKDTNLPHAPLFPKVENMTLHSTSHLKSIAINFQDTLQSLKIYGSPSAKVTFANTPQHLRSFKGSYNTSYSNKHLPFSSLYMPSLASGSLKKLKLNQCRSKPPEIEYLGQCNQLEELYVPYTYDIDEVLASSISNHRGLKLLQFVEFIPNNNGSWSAPILMMEGFYHFSNLKQLRELGVCSSALNLKGAFMTVINSLPNLTSLKFARHEKDSNFSNLYYFAENSNLAGLQKFKSSILLISPEERNRFCELVAILLTRHIKLESLKLVVRGLPPNLLQTIIPYIINLCKEHPSLYKFNGIPIKALESGKVASINLHEDLLITSVPFGNNMDSDLTMGILHCYRNSLDSLSELRIKPEKAVVINVYLPKLVKQIQEIGCFSDIKHEFNFPLFSFLTIFIAIRKKPEFKCLKLQTMCANNWFLETLRECENLEKYEGPYSESYNEIFRSMPKFNTVTIKNLTSERELMLPNLRQVRIKNTVFKEDKNLILHIPTGLQELYLENVSFTNHIAVAHVVESLNTLQNLRKLVLFVTFKDKASMNSLVLFIGNLGNLESLDISVDFLPKENIEDGELIRNMKITLAKLKKIREFSLTVPNVTSKGILDRYFEFILEYKNLNRNLEKINGIIPADFNRNLFQSRFY